MPSNSVFRWRDGAGWLIFAGAANSETRGNVIAKISVDGGIAYVSLGGDVVGKLTQAEQTLDDMEDLGAPSGYIVDVAAEDDSAVQERLSESGVIVISGGSSPEAVRSALLGAAMQGIEAAYEKGALLLLEGNAAAAFGGWLVAGGKPIQGLNWLHQTLLLPNVTTLTEAPAARTLLSLEPDAIVVGLGADSALALGPNGELEMWGEQRAAVALGRGYQA